MPTLLKANPNPSRSLHRESDLACSEPLSATAPARRLAEPAKTLLVVDDNPAVRELETQILRLQGYTVLEAGSAAEAMRLAATSVIHLLITELALPEVDGLELIRRFRTVHPSTPVLMVSGSLPLLRDRAEQDLERVMLLAKPFLYNELLEKVHALLLEAAARLPKPIPSRAD